jgi:hypothetical protein
VKLVEVIPLLKYKSEISLEDVYLANPDTQKETCRKSVYALIGVGFVSVEGLDNGRILKPWSIIRLTDKTFDVRVRENKNWRKKICPVSV